MRICTYTAIRPLAHTYKLDQDPHFMIQREGGATWTFTYTSDSGEREVLTRSDDGTALLRLISKFMNAYWKETT